MPFHYRYFSDLNCLYVVGSGKVLLQDFLDYHRTLKIDSVHSTLAILADYRELDPSDLSSSDIENIRRSALKKMEGRFDTMKEAIVVSGALAYGLSRMFDGMVYSEKYEMNTFTDVSKAKAWLGLDSAIALGLVD
jgi:hypothetical protein